jgi:acetyltransferase-like isoleucine patch superfamily enzyme
VQSCGPIVIGAYSYIGTNCVILRDAKVPPRSLVAAGTVVTDRALEDDSLIGGVPAKVIRPIPDDWAHFRREVGRVD